MLTGQPVTITRNSVAVSDGSTNVDGEFGQHRARLSRKNFEMPRTPRRA